MTFFVYKSGAPSIRSTNRGHAEWEVGSTRIPACMPSFLAWFDCCHSHSSAPSRLATSPSSAMTPFPPSLEHACSQRSLDSRDFALVELSLDRRHRADSDLTDVLEQVSDLTIRPPMDETVCETPQSAVARGCSSRQSDEHHKRKSSFCPVTPVSTSSWFMPFKRLRSRSSLLLQDAPRLPSSPELSVHEPQFPEPQFAAVRRPVVPPPRLEPLGDLGLGPPPMPLFGSSPVASVPKILPMRTTDASFLAP